MSLSTNLTRDGFEYLSDISHCSIVIDQLKITFHGIRYDENHRIAPIASHIHDFFEFHYILDGEVKTIISNTGFTCNPGQFYLIPPRCVHSHRCDAEHSNHYNGFAIRWGLERVNSHSFNPELDTLRFSLENASIVVLNDESGTVMQQMSYIIDIAKSNCMRSNLLFSMASLLLAIGKYYISPNIQKLPQPKPIETTNVILQNAISYIACHLSEPISASDVAANIPISYSHLARIFSKQMNTTVNRYITTMRIDRATHLLMTTDMDIDKISLAVGYTSQSYFAYVFKNTYGLSPRDYRRYWGKQYFQGDPTGLM